MPLERLRNDVPGRRGEARHGVADRAVFGTTQPGSPARQQPLPQLQTAIIGDAGLRARPATVSEFWHWQPPQPVLNILLQQSQLHEKTLQLQSGVVRAMHLHVPMQLSRQFARQTAPAGVVSARASSHPAASESEAKR